MRNETKHVIRDKTRNKEMLNLNSKLNMKTTLLSILLVCAYGLINPTQTKGQSLLNAEVSYSAESGISNGASLGIEYEKFFSENFSLPLKVSAGYTVKSDYNSFSIELHKGFRKYFGNGFFGEQYLGLGMMANYYKVESIWYYDQFDNLVRFKDGANWGFMPSVTIGGGYNITHKKGTSNFIWVRPKIYWNFGLRGLAMPFSSVQIGFTHNIKNSK